ncbi:MAG: exonuclease SbcCD subunit D [Micrococcaceae bacterium]
MRLLHTSDWHLGRSFHGTGMLETQRDFLAALAETVRSERIDVVAVSGDIYDRALPAVDAVEALDAALAEIRAAGAQIVLTSGNHDSAVRLGFGAQLMSAAGVTLRTSTEELDTPVVFEDDEQILLVYGIPYIEPRHVSASWQIEAHHTAVITEAMRRINADVSARRDAADGRTVVTVVMAHVFAAGGDGSDSERDIGADHLQGGLGQVPARVFDGMDYVALGHLHGRQRITDTVRYSGSPLPYSFSEARQAKGGWILTIEQGAVQAIDPVEWRVGRTLHVLESEIEDLLTNAAYTAAESGWCQITVTDEHRPPQAYARLKDRFPGMLNFILAPSVVRAPVTSYASKIDAATTDLQVCTDFLDHVRHRPASEEETALLSTALEHGRSTEAEAGR